MRRFSGGLVKKRTRGAVRHAAALVAAAHAGRSRPRRRARRSRPTRDAVTGGAARPWSGLPRRCPERVLHCAAAERQPGRHRGRRGRPRRRSRATGRRSSSLSTGDATQADQPDQPGRSPASTTAAALVRQPAATAHSTSRCCRSNFSQRRAAARPRAVFGFDFRFLSEEYPTELGSAFNDAFIAEVDNVTAWTTAGADDPRRRTTSPRLPSASR